MRRKPSNQSYKLNSCIVENDLYLELVPEEMTNGALVQGMMIAPQSLVHATPGAEASSDSANREPTRHVPPGHHVSIPLDDHSSSTAATREQFSAP
jgi:hypothetical protein